MFVGEILFSLIPAQFSSNLCSWQHEKAEDLRSEPSFSRVLCPGGDAGHFLPSDEARAQRQWHWDCVQLQPPRPGRPPIPPRAGGPRPLTTPPNTPSIRTYQEVSGSLAREGSGRRVSGTVLQAMSTPGRLLQVPQFRTHSLAAFFKVLLMDLEPLLLFLRLCS